MGRNGSVLVVTVVLFCFVQTVLEAQVRCPGFGDAADDLPASAKGWPPLRVHGVITDEAGDPLANVSIAIYCGHGGSVPASLELVTDSTGHYRYELAVRRASYRVVIRSTDFIELEDSIGARDAGEFQRNYKLRKPVGSVRGVVYDEARKPVSGARVSLHGYSMEMQRTVHTSVATAVTRFARSTISEADGSFFLTDVPAGSYSLSAFFAGSGSERARVDLQAGETTLDLALQPRGRKISFRVLDETGRPVQGVNIHGAAIGMTSWSNGTVHGVVRGSSDRPLRCLVNASGYEAREIEIYRQAIEHPDVILSPAPILRGKVMDEDGNPVPGLRFDVQFYWRTKNPARGERPHTIGFGSAHPRTKDDGSFECPVAGFPSPDLELDVQVRERGFVAQTLAVTEADMRTGLTLTLARPAGGISGQVLGPDGQPLNTFQVTAMSPGPTPSPEPDYRADRLVLASRLCSFGRFEQSDGQFFLEDLPEGELALSALGQQGGRTVTGHIRIKMTKGAPSPRVVIQCEPGGVGPFLP